MPGQARKLTLRAGSISAALRLYFAQITIPAQVGMVSLAQIKTPGRPGVKDCRWACSPLFERHCLSEGVKIVGPLLGLFEFDFVFFDEVCQVFFHRNHFLVVAGGGFGLQL